MELTEWSDPFKVEEAHDGIERRVLSFDDTLMLVHYTLKKGAVFPVHTHDETYQGVFVINGAIELFGDQSATLESGDTFVVGPGTEHGIRGLEPGTRLIDSFTPPIEPYGERS